MLYVGLMTPTLHWRHVRSTIFFASTLLNGSLHSAARAWLIAAVSQWSTRARGSRRVGRPALLWSAFKELIDALWSFVIISNGLLFLCCRPQQFGRSLAAVHGSSTESAQCASVVRFYSVDLMCIKLRKWHISTCSITDQFRFLANPGVFCRLQKMINIQYHCHCHIWKLNQFMHA